MTTKTFDVAGFDLERTIRDASRGLDAEVTQRSRPERYVVKLPNGQLLVKKIGNMVHMDAYYDNLQDSPTQEGRDAIENTVLNYNRNIESRPRRSISEINFKVPLSEAEDALLIYLRTNFQVYGARNAFKQELKNLENL